MVRFVLLVIVLSSFTFQNTNYWKILAQVTFETKVDAEGYEVPFPVFKEGVKKIDKTVISLKGYIIPLEQFRNQKYFMFSSLPFNNCFFCGGAGPETVVEVYAVDKVPFTNKLIEVKGTIELNNTDPNHHMYIMRNAKIILTK